MVWNNNDNNYHRPMSGNQRKGKERQIQKPASKLKKIKNKNKTTNKQTKKITTEHEDDGYTNSNWCTWNSPQKFSMTPRSV